MTDQDLIERLKRNADCLTSWENGIGPHANVADISGAMAKTARQAASRLETLSALLQQAGGALGPYAAAIEQADARYRDRGGDPAMLQDRAPFVSFTVYRMKAAEWLAISRRGPWTKARETLTKIRNAQQVGEEG